MFCVVNTKVMEIMMYQIGYIDGQCLRKFIQACGHKNYWTQKQETARESPAGHTSAAMIHLPQWTTNWTSDENNQRQSMSWGIWLRLMPVMEMVFTYLKGYRVVFP